MTRSLNAARRFWLWVAHLIQQPVVLVLLFAICFTLIGLTLVRQNNAAQHELDRQRDNFCGFVQPIGQLGGIPGTPATVTGKGLVDQIAAIKQGANDTAARLGCKAISQENH